jgi:hypothetical protein
MLASVQAGFMLERVRKSLECGVLYACKGAHPLFTGQRESEKEKERERCINFF